MLPGLPGGEGLSNFETVFNKIVADAISEAAPPSSKWPEILDECCIGWPGVTEFEYDGQRYLMDTNRIFDYDFKITPWITP